jgi:hypothetical protein
MKRLGVLVAAAALGTALIASSPAEAFRGGGFGGGFHGGGFGGGRFGGWGGFRGGSFGGFRGGMFAGRSVAVTGFNRGGWGRWGSWGNRGWGWGNRGWGLGPSLGVGRLVAGALDGAGDTLCL